MDGTHTTPTPESMLPLPGREQVLKQATELILDAWRSFDHARPYQPSASERHRQMLATGLPDIGLDPTTALHDAVDVLDVSLSQSRPRYFAYIGSSGLEIGVLADALMASHDVNVAVSSGAADLLEAQVIRWMGEFTGFDTNASGLLAAGGTISNLTALTAARERALPGVRQYGTGDRRLALYCSDESHYSICRAAEVLGIGSDNVRRIAIDGERRMDAGKLRTALEQDLADEIIPVAVVATAGTTLSGTVDDIDALADICDELGVWLHVDGAYGLPAAATSAKQLFKGLSRANSATVDAHKWLYVPKACSVLLVHNPKVLEQAFSHNEDYIPHSGQAPSHPVDRTLEYSRPLNALKLWLAFRVHGADALRAAIQKNLDEAELLTKLFGADDRIEILKHPELSVVVFRRRLPGATADAEDDFNHELAAAVRDDGRILIAPATADGRVWLRACFVNHRTTDEDVRAIPQVVAEVAEQLLA